jgi:hypothetical protein
MNRVVLINSALSRYLFADSQHQLNIINLGVTTFQRNSSKANAGVECIFRISQDGVNFLVPQLEKRVIRTKSLVDFKQLILRKYQDIQSDIKCPTLRQDLDDMTIGCFVILYETEDNNVEPLVMHRFMHNIASMIAKENLFSLHQRYLNAEERKQCEKVEDHQSFAKSN